MHRLFSPIALGGLQLSNRIVIPPMCQYSAEDGRAGEWHYMHYGHLAVSGAGLLIVEATAVEPEGRITPHDLGLWSDELEQSQQNMVAFLRQFTRMPLAVQLAHAGRKASTSAPWQGGKPLPENQGGWPVCAPSALAYDAVSPVPAALNPAGLERLRTAFAASARRAARAGYDAVELHAAHGYLLHQFLSPLANAREDVYGGSLENRMRFPLEVFAAMRAALPPGFPLGVRVSGTDFAPGGWNIAECVSFAEELERAGCSFIHVSGGGLTPEQEISLAPGYQVPLAAEIKAAVNMPVIAVGLITEAELACGVIVTGQADLVAIGRGMLYDPRWPWHAAAELGLSLADVPPQYWRSRPRKFKRLFVE